MHNYQQLNLKQNKTKTKQTSRTGTESQVWGSAGGVPAGRGKREKEGNSTGIKKHNW